MRPQIVPSGGASPPPLPLAPFAGISPRGRPAAAGAGILPRRYPSAGGGSFRTAPLRHRGPAPPAPLSPARSGAPRRRHGPDPAHPLPGASAGGRGGGRVAASLRRGSRPGTVPGEKRRACPRCLRVGRPGALGGVFALPVSEGSGSASRRAPSGRGRARHPALAGAPRAVLRRGGRGWRGARAVRAGPAGRGWLLCASRGSARGKSRPSAGSVRHGG